MKRLEDFASSVAVVVSSCDAFFDAWKPFAFFFRKYWGDCPLPVYLIVNELPVRSKRFRVIAVGEDRGWASNLELVLRQIENSHVLYFQEDYFLDGPVQREQLAADLAYALKDDSDSFCFRAEAALGATFQPINERFGIVPRASEYRTRCQATVWKRDVLLSVLRPGETAWEMESRGSGRTRELRALSYSSREGTPIPYLMSAIVRGLWAPKALRMCADNRIAIQPHFRATHCDNSLLRKIRRARTRMRLPRELARARRTGLDLDAE